MTFGKLGPNKSEENAALLRYLVVNKPPETGDDDAPLQRIVVVGKHKYYDLFNVQLIDYAPGPAGSCVVRSCRSIRWTCCGIRRIPTG